MAKHDFETTNNKTVTLTADPSDDTARLDDVSMSGYSSIIASVKANADNTGNVYIRKYGSGGDWIPLAAGDAVNLTVKNLQDVEAYSDNGTEVLNTIISLA